ncbi:hypothetical protein ACF0H5_011450 [Mactra antiquata]
MDNLKFIFLLFATLASIQVLQATDLSNFYKCMVNTDCGDERLCCSYTAALGRRNIQGRQLPPDWDGMVHYCLPWKNENATWCDLKLQYSEAAPNYLGLCPCGPGLRCEPTTELDPHWYPRDRYGKCVQVTE